MSASRLPRATPRLSRHDRPCPLCASFRCFRPQRDPERTWQGQHATAFGELGSGETRVASRPRGAARPSGGASAWPERVGSPAASPRFQPEVGAPAPRQRARLPRGGCSDLQGGCPSPRGGHPEPQSWRPVTLGRTPGAPGWAPSPRGLFSAPAAARVSGRVSGVFSFPGAGSPGSAAGADLFSLFSPLQESLHHSAATTFTVRQASSKQTSHLN